jgi:hypothetical protein
MVAYFSNEAWRGCTKAEDVVEVGEGQKAYIDVHECSRQFVREGLIAKPD